MIVLDASVLVAFFESSDAHHERALTMLQDNATSPWGASAMTLAEFLVGPARLGESAFETAVNALDVLGVDQLQDPVDTPIKLARIRASTGLKLPDCHVLLVAEAAMAAVASFDSVLAKAAQARGLSVIAG
jgi:predicted nucleic acid-binding protein